MPSSSLLSIISIHLQNLWCSGSILTSRSSECIKLSFFIFFKVKFGRGVLWVGSFWKDYYFLNLVFSNCSKYSSGEYALRSNAVSHLSRERYWQLDIVSLLLSARGKQAFVFQVTHGRPLAQQKLWVQGDAMGPGGGKLSINGSQEWSVVLLQHRELLYVAWTGSWGCSCPPQNQLIVEAVATIGSPPGALRWGNVWALGICQPLKAPLEQSDLLASLTAMYFRPLAISPTLAIIPHDGKNPLQELAQECSISRIKINFCFQ